MAEGLARTPDVVTVRPWPRVRRSSGRHRRDVGAGRRPGRPRAEPGARQPAVHGRPPCDRARPAINAQSGDSSGDVSPTRGALRRACEGRDATAAGRAFPSRPSARPVSPLELQSRLAAEGVRAIAAVVTADRSPRPTAYPDLVAWTGRYRLRRRRPETARVPGRRDDIPADGRRWLAGLNPRPAPAAG